MSGITGLGTTYNLPNYTGILFGLTPTETPFFSAIGGLNGGGQATSVEFEWETFDLRSAAQNTKTEGATAPTAEERVRANVTNVVQIHQEKVSVAYSKLAAFGQKAGTNNGATNPITDELDWQTRQMLVQMVRDVEYSFINGAYVKPSDNASARQTKGLVAAITSNKADAGTALPATTGVAATDLFTSTAHGMAAGDGVYFTALTGGAGLELNRLYYVISDTLAANTFKLSTVRGGTAVNFTTDVSASTAKKAATMATTHIDDLLQSAYDNGGISDQNTATLIVNSAMKRAITAAYMSAYGKFVESSRTVGGVNVQTIETDFGTLNVMLNRFLPQGQIVVASLDQCRPVFLEVPGKGHFFAEPLAKTGASDEVQLYGEVGLAYGNEKAHAWGVGYK